MPSVPGWTSFTRPKGQYVGALWGIFIITMSPTITFGCCRVHFVRRCSEDKYSADHRFQNDWVHCRINSHRVNRFIGIDVKSRDGNATNGCPIRKSPGVSERKSFGSDDKTVRGLELRMASICVDSVDISSNVNVWTPITRFKWYLADLTAASQIPPKWGAAGGLKCHLHGNSVVCRLAAVVNISCSCRLAPWKLARSPNKYPMEYPDEKWIDWKKP